MKGPISLESFAAKLDRLAENVDDLAVMTKEGFEQAGHRLESLEQGQEDIKLRLGEAAYRFELVELQHRVGNIERQIGMTQ